MQKFAFKGTDARGQIHEGVRDAENEEDARLAMAARGLRPLELRVAEPVAPLLTSGRLRLGSLPHEAPYEGVARRELGLKPTGPPPSASATSLVFF